MRHEATGKPRPARRLAHSRKRLRLALAAGLLLLAGSRASAQELLDNGTFSDGMNGWPFFAQPGAAAQPDSAGDEVCVAIDSGGVNVFDLVLFQRFLPIETGATYQVSFRARADANRNLSASVSQSEAPFTSYDFQTRALTTSYQTFTRSFVMSEPGDSCAQFVFHLGGQGATDVCIDDVSLVRLSPGAPIPDAGPPPAAGTPPLRELGAAQGIRMGAMAELQPLFCEGQFADVLAREYDRTTAANALKWDYLRPERDTFSFRDADRMVDWAEANGLEMHGTILAWYFQVPNWLTDGNFDESELRELLQEHISTVVGRYAGRIKSWDVVGEAVDEAGNLRPGVWLDGIGPEYIDLAFQWARAADPNAQLLYQDFNFEGVGVKSNAVYGLVSDLVTRGIPIDGVGFQSHFILGASPTPADVAWNMARYHAIAIDAYVAEFDVRILEPASAQDLDDQADIYADMLSVCLAAPNCNRFMTWGLTDAHSWIPGFFPAYGSALPFDEALEPKPAYWAMHATLPVIGVPALSAAGLAGLAGALIAAYCWRTRSRPGMRERGRTR